MAVTGSYGFNPLQDLKSKVKQTVYGYDDATADRFSKQGQLYTYLLSIEKLGKTKEDWENFNNTYKMFDYMSDDYKDFALMNEAQYKPSNYTEEELSKLSDEERKIYNEQTKKTLRTWTDENGQQVSQEMTDYDWNKKLLEWKGEDIQQELVKKQFEELQASKNWFQKAFEKVIATDEAILRNVVTGALDAVGDLYNLLEGVVSAAGAAITGNDVEAWWREAVGTNELAFIGEAMERATFDWERQWGVRDYYGNKDWFGNMADGIANSFGRMAPTMLISWGGSSLAAAKGVKAGISSANLLNAVDNTSKTISAISKTSQLLFYASMAQSDITEMLNDEATASLPTWQIFASAYASAGMELLVEKGLDKLLGTSVLDSMLYGFNASSKGVLSKAGKEIGKLTKGKVATTILGRMAADAFHEGMEEVLQDWSHVFVNGFFETLNYAMGNTEYANIFHDANTFSFQTAIDAFVSGAVMSIIGSGFDYIKTKRLGLASVTTDSKGNVKQEKLSKARSWLYKDAMASIDNSVHELLDSGKLTLEEKTDLISGLNTSMKTISAIFEGMGQERFAQANKLLQAMNDTMLSKQRAASEVYSFVKDVWTEYGVKRLAENAKKFEERQLDKPIYNVSRESELDEIREATATEKDTIKQIFADCATIENVIATKEGTGAILTDDKTLIVPAAQLANLDAATIEKDINEQVIVSQITKVPQLKVAIDQIFKTFKELPINKDKRNLSKETAITYLLLNPDFARTCLYTGDVNIVQFISQLDKLVASLKVSDTLTAQHKKMLDLGIDNLKQIYADYCKSMQYADINVDILSEAQRQDIIKERWNKDLANRIEAGKKLNEADYRNLSNRVNSLTINVDKKTELINSLHSNDKSERLKAFKQLAQLQYGQFYSLFDDITYPSDRSVLGITLYNFLRSQGITLQDIIKSGVITVNGETFNARQYYENQFAEYTNQQYTLTYDNDKIEIRQKEAEPFTSAAQKQVRKLREYGLSDKSKIGIKSSNSDFDRSILKSDINAAYKNMLTIDDVINTPSMLSKDILIKVKETYGSISPQNVYKYLKYEFLNKSNGIKSIGLTSDNKYVMVDVSDMSNMKSSKFDTVLEDFINTIFEAEKGNTEAITKLKKGYSIKNLIDKKYLTRIEDTNVRITMSKGNMEQVTYYDPKDNTIYISKEYLQAIHDRKGLTDEQRNKAYLNEVSSLILHEFSHAIQIHNGMNTGLGDFLSRETDTKDSIKVIEDMREHYELSNKKDLLNREQVNNIIYYGSGEAGAYGYEFDPEVQYDTFIRTDLPNDEIRITTPWGSTYTTKGNNIEVAKSTIIDVKRDYPDSHYIHKSNENVTLKIANAVFAKFGKTGQTEFETKLRKTRPNADNYKSTTKDQCIINYIDIVKDYAKQYNIKVNENDLLVEASTFLSRSKYWKDTQTLKNLNKPQAQRIFDRYIERNFEQYYNVLDAQGFEDERKTNITNADYSELLDTITPITDTWRHSANVGTTIKKGATNARDNLYNSITPTIRENMLKVAYIDITKGYGVTFDEFLEMDIPYFRFQASDKIYDTGTFASAALGIDGYRMITSYFGEGRRGKAGYLIFGSIKPKNLIGYVPFDMVEGLIKVTDLANADGVVSVVNQKGMNYVTDFVKTLDGDVLEFDKALNYEIDTQIEFAKKSTEFKQTFLKLADHYSEYKSFTSWNTLDPTIFILPNKEFSAVLVDETAFAKSDFKFTEYDISKYLNTHSVAQVIAKKFLKSYAAEIRIGKIDNDVIKSVKYFINKLKNISDIEITFKLIYQSNMSGRYSDLNISENDLDNVNDLEKKLLNLEKKVLTQEIEDLKEIEQADKTFAAEHPNAMELNVAAIGAKTLLSKQTGETEQTTEADITEKSTGFQMTSEEYSEYQKAKAKLAKQKKEAYAKRSYVSKTREANTNLKYYAGQNINSDIQNIIRSTTGYEKAYDKALIEKIKDGDFRTKSDVYEYVRKHNMNENTFNLLNKQYFKNINITSAEQLSKLVEMSGNYYALRAAIRSMGDALDIDVSNYLYGQMNAKSLNELLRRLKNEAPNAFKIYQDVLSRYQGYRSKSVEDFLSQDLSKMSPEEKTDYEKKKKIIEARESKQTQVDTELLKVAYLNGYDGTLESAARIANWARQLALTPELKRTGEISTVSMEKSIKDTKGDNLTIGERIADTYSFESDFEDFPWAADDVRTMAQDIYQNRFAEYLNRIVGKDNMYLATKELQAVLKQKGIDYKTVLAEKQRILDEVSKLSTEQVIEEYRSMEIEEVFDVKVKVRADLQRNLTQKANRVIKALANKKKAFAKLVEMYPDLGFTTDKEWHMPTKNGKLLNQDEMYVLSKQLSQILKYANAGAFDPLVQAQKEKLVKQQEMISELKKKQSDLQRELKLTKQARKNTYQQIEDIKFNTTEFTMQSTRAMPEKFKQVLDTVFTKLAKTKGKFTNINEYHTVKNYDEWVDANIETLSSLTEYEANEILDYILNSTPVYAKFGSDDYVRYQAISIFMTSYLYARQADLKINTSLLMQAEEMFDNIQSASGTIMKISQGLMNKVDITGKTLRMLSKQSGVDFRQSDIDELAHIIDKHKDAKTEAEVKNAIEEYQAQYRRMSQRLLADYKDSDKRNAWSKLQSFQKMAMLSSPGTWLRNITSNVILQKTDAPLAKLGQFFFGKISKIADKWDTVGKSKLVKPEFDTKYDQGLSIANEYYDFDIDNFTDDDMKRSITLAIKERNEALKVKNATGDMLKYYHSQIADIDERIGALKYAQSTADATQRLILAGRIEALQRKSLMFANPDYIIHQATQAIDALEEYKIYRSKLEKYEAKVKGNPLRRTLTNQYKLIGTEVDAKTAEFVQTMVIDSGLFDMIKDGLNKFNPNSKVNTAESKITKLIMDSVMNNVFMNNQFDSKTMNKMSQLLFKVLSDEKWINKTFVSYLGKMLVEDKVDLTKGLSSQVMETIANAYSYAAYTYMHKSNFMNDIEKAIKDRIGPKAYFVYKQIFPFANASVNWWIEGLNWTPVGLAKAIRNIVNFDNYVSKMEANAVRGRGPSERFAYYEVRRNLGKGIVGTTGFLAAMLAAAFGLIRLKEDDYGDLKITIGSGNAEVSLDFSEITGTTGFGWGLVIGNAIKGDDGFDIFADTLNMMFESSIFTDLYDMVNYNSTFGEMLTEMPERIIKTFIPNIIQVFNSSLYSQKIKYSSGVMGMLERCAVKLIPGIAYAMPTKYDIYTGELQYKYYPNMLGWVADLVSRFGPVKIGTAKISPMERIAESLDIHKGQLNGKYEDIGNFSSEQVAKLNEMYGSLNKNELDKLVNNKQRYRVQDKKTGKYVEKYYRNMTDEEKSTVIKRIMSNNSTYAKIYVWTSEGHKYYCSSSEYATLAKLGITKNVYRTSNSKQLMNKFVK